MEEKENEEKDKKHDWLKFYRKRIRFYFWPRLPPLYNGAFTHLYTRRRVHSGPRVNVFTYSWFYDRLVVVYTVPWYTQAYVQLGE